MSTVVVDPRLLRIEEALVAAHNALALVSGLVTDYVESNAPIREVDNAILPCCVAPHLEPLMGGTTICTNCGAGSTPRE